VVQLNDTTTSTSVTEALTANQGKNLQDQINALSITSNITLAGTLDTVTGNLVTVTTAGAAAGFAVGSSLPAAAAGNAEYFVIVTVAAASYTPPGGTSTQTHVGDWFLSDGTVWDFLDVGFDPPYASTTTPGVVQLATNAQVQAGTDATLAVTPTGAAATYVPLADYTTKGDILAASGAGTPTALPVGTDGQILYANSACASGLEWGTNPITCLDFDAKGDLLAGVGPDSFATLGVGTDGQILFACSTAATGLCWATAPATPAATPTLAGSVLGCTTSDQASLGCNALLNVTTGTQNVGVGAYSLYCLTSGTQNTAIGYGAGDTLVSGSNNVIVGTTNVTNPNGSCQLAIGFQGTNWLTGDSTKAIKPGAGIIDCANSCGTAGQVLMSNGANAICWGSPAATPAATPTVAGIVFGCTISTLAALGCDALISNTTGARNTAIGTAALCSNSLGRDNTALGFGAAAFVTGCNNTAIGRSAIPTTTGNGNTAIGTCANFGSTTGVNNTIVGFCAMPLSNGNTNVVIGACAGSNMTNGNCNVVIGPSVTTPGAALGCTLVIGYGSNYWLTGNSTKAIRPGAGIIDCASSCGTTGQVLTSNGSNAIAWANPTTLSYTANKALTSGTPIDLLSWATGVRMGTLTIMATDNSSNVKWANITIGSASGIGSSGVLTQSVGVGNFSIIAGGGGETIVRFTPSVTLASVDFVYQYTVAFGAQPSVL
jgi:hypothetical protein